MYSRPSTNSSPLSNTPFQTRSGQQQRGDIINTSPATSNLRESTTSSLKERRTQSERADTDTTIHLKENRENVVLSGPKNPRSLGKGSIAAIIGAATVGVGLLVGVGRLVEGGALRGENLLAVAEWFESLGEGASVLYGLLYFVLELVAVPALPLTLGSGYLFGLVKGTVVASLAATAASCAAFAAARYALRGYIVGVASKYPKFRAIDRAIGREGFKFVFLLRLSPLLPFSISNYLYGVTSVSFWPYFLGSWLGMLPGTIAYVSGGAAVNALTDLTSKSGGITNVNPYLVVIGLLATIGALVTVGNIASKAIKDAEEFDEKETEESRGSV